MAQQRVGLGPASDTLALQDHPVTAASERARVLPRILDRLALVVVGTALALLLHTYVLGIVVVDGNSMAPSLHGGDQVLMEKVTPRLGTVERGDVVVLRRPGSGELLVKRVLATAGEVIAAQCGRVYVNGEPLNETRYTVMSTRYVFGEYTVGPDEVFVLGDNRESSDDSASWGPVAVREVIGCCLARPLPVGRRELHHDNRYADDGSIPEASGGQRVRAAAPRAPRAGSQ